MKSRKEILLKAAYDLLKKQYEARVVLDLLTETAFYDGTECDGFCLMDDIANELGIE